MSLGVGPARWMGIQGHEAKGRQVDKEPEGLSLTCPVVLGDLFPLRGHFLMWETDPLK